MKALTLSIAISTLVLAGCATSNTSHVPQLTETSPAEAGHVTIYRQHSLQAKLAKAYVGTADGYFAQLDEDQHVTFDIEPGFHVLKARAHGSVSSQSHFKVNPGESLCIEARPNHEEMEWLAVPFLNALIPSFVLEETPCPEPTQMGEALIL